MLPIISSYGQYSSNNCGSHTLKIDLDKIVFYYSYDTIVAFATDEGLVCSENVWGTTTGKHLNWIQSDKKKRIPRSTFETMLKTAIQKHIQ